jgi:hypothetical protein
MNSQSDSDAESRVLRYWLGSKAGPNFLGMLGTPASGLMFSQLFVPKTVLIDGVVFLARLNWQDPDYISSRQRLLLELSQQNLKQQIEKLSNYNWIELVDSVQPLLHPRAAAPYDEGVDDEMYTSCLRLLASRVAEAWDGILHRRYPQRRFRVYLLDDLEENDSLGVVLEEIDDPLASYAPQTER